MFDGQIDGLADDPLVPNFCRANEIGCQIKHGVAVEFGGEPLFGQFDPIPLHPRKGDFKGIAIRPNSVHPDRLSGFDRRRNDRLRREVEWDAEDVGILHIEPLFLIEIIGLAAQPSPDDLFTE